MIRAKGAPTVASGPGTDPFGAVVRVDKPEGPTSHDVVASARRAFDTRRIGHTGTLDPFASGLLLLCVGRSTRLAEYLTGLPKAYTAVLRLGIVTDTDDRMGRTVRESDAWRSLDRARLEDAFATQRGRIRQRPPAFSAKRVRGERMYARARRGELVELQPVEVTVHRLEIRGIDLPDVTFEIECSSGTYVRAVARDVGEACGSGAHLIRLRRIRIGPHDVSDAVEADRLDDPAAVLRASLSPLAALRHLPRIDVDDDAARVLGHGRSVPAVADDPEEGAVAVAYRDRLLAVAEVRDGRVRPRKVFAA